MPSASMMNVPPLGHAALRVKDAVLLRHGAVRPEVREQVEGVAFPLRVGALGKLAVHRQAEHDGVGVFEERKVVPDFTEFARADAGEGKGKNTRTTARPRSSDSRTGSPNWFTSSKSGAGTPQPARQSRPWLEPTLRGRVGSLVLPRDQAGGAPVLGDAGRGGVVQPCGRGCVLDVRRRDVAHPA